MTTEESTGAVPGGVVVVVLVVRSIVQVGAVALATEEGVGMVGRGLLLSRWRRRRRVV